MMSRQVVFSPEASCVSPVVIVDVGDDISEPNDTGSVRVFTGSSGHTEGRLLLYSNSPAATETTQSDAQSSSNPSSVPQGKKQTVGPP